MMPEWLWADRFADPPQLAVEPPKAEAALRLPEIVLASVAGPDDAGRPADLV